MPRPFFDAALSLSVPHCSDTWQGCDPSLAVLLQAPYCRVPSLPYWLSDRCDLQPSFSTPMAIKHGMLALCDASEGRGGAERSHSACSWQIPLWRWGIKWPCGCRWVRAHMCILIPSRICILARLCQPGCRRCERDGCVQRARINFRCSIAANAKPVPVFVSLQLRITRSLLVSRNDGKCPSHETPLQYICRPTHQQLLISPSKTLNVKP